MHSYLDTSVTRNLLHSTRKHRRYLDDQLGPGPHYVNNYVLMEIKRSFLCSVIDFYFLLGMRHIETIEDAFQVWSNKFKSSEQKAIIQLVPALFEGHRLNPANPADKPRGLQVLSFLIRRIEAQLRTDFRNVGSDSTGCARALVPLRADREHPEQGLRVFREQFGDVDACRSRCHIDRFFLVRNRAAVDNYVTAAPALKRRGDTRGFVDISAALTNLVDRGPSAFTCKSCERIGDAVIALDAPRSMQLEHTDYSFDHLCPPIKQPHRRLLSQATFHPAQESAAAERLEDSGV